MTRRGDAQSPDDPSVPTIVVGTDGSDHALRAVAAAALEARAFGCRLEVVHAFIWPELRVPLGSAVGAQDGPGLRRAADRIVSEAVEHARRATPEVAVTGRVAVGAPTPVLLRASIDAALVVVGDRGLGGFTGLLVGSVALALVTYGRCPVLVVRGRVEPVGPVVVGVDGSEAAATAAELARAWAAAHGAPLRAVRVAPAGADDRSTDPAPESLEPAPGVAIEHVVLQGDARRVLVDESETARLLVVGSRGRGGFAGLLLGSVSQGVLHHAACPVAVVPHVTTGVRLVPGGGAVRPTP